MDAMKGHNYSYVFNFEQVAILYFLPLLGPLKDSTNTQHWPGFCSGTGSDMDGGELAACVCLGQWHLHAAHLWRPDLYGQQVTSVT